MASFFADKAGDGLDARPDAEASTGQQDMIVDGARGQPERLPDLSRRHPFGGKAQAVELARGQDQRGLNDGGCRGQGKGLGHGLKPDPD